MKLNKIYLILLITVIFFLYACQEEVSNNEIKENTPTSLDESGLLEISTATIPISIPSTPEPTKSAEPQEQTQSHQENLQSKLTIGDVSSPTPFPSTKLPSSATVTPTPIQPTSSCNTFNLVSQKEISLLIELEEEEICCNSTSQILQVISNPFSETPQAFITIQTGRNGQEILATSFLVDFSKNKYLTLGLNDSKYHQKFGWLNSNTAIWINSAGKVLMGSVEETEELLASEEFINLWAINSNNVLLFNSLMQPQLISVKDNEVLDIADMDADGISINAPIFIGNTNSSQDQILFFQWDSVVIFNLTNQSFSRIDPQEAYKIVGSDNTQWNPPEQLSDTNYWFIDVPIWRQFEGELYPSDGFIVDTDSAEIIDGEALEIPSDLTILSTSLSPDNKNIAVETSQFRSNSVLNTYYYSEFLELINIESGEFSGWEPQDITLEINLECS